MNAQLKVWWVIYRCTVLGCVVQVGYSLGGGMMNMSKYHQMLFSSRWLEYIEVHQSLVLCSAVKDRISSVMVTSLALWTLAEGFPVTSFWPHQSWRQTSGHAVQTFSLPFKIKYVYKKHLKHQCHPYKHFESTHLLELKPCAWQNGKCVHHWNRRRKTFDVLCWQKHANGFHTHTIKIKNTLP